MVEACLGELRVDLLEYRTIQSTMWGVSGRRWVTDG